MITALSQTKSYIAAASSAANTPPQRSQLISSPFYSPADFRPHELRPLPLLNRYGESEAILTDSP